jgi:hypothetical protein
MGKVTETINEELAGITKAMEFFCCPARAGMTPDMVMSIANRVYRTLSCGPRSSYGLGFYTAAKYIANARKLSTDNNT